MPGFQLLLFAPIVIFIVVAFPEGVVGWVKRRAKGTAIQSYLL
jgi:branched-chain amino acid transport system permease protein